MRLAVLLWGAVLGALAGPLLPALAQTGTWVNVQLKADYKTKDGTVIPKGTYVCQEPNTKAIFKPPYASKGDVTKACNDYTPFVPWLFGSAEAAPISKMLGNGTSCNPDGVCDTSKDCLDGTTNCRPPVGVSWNAAVLAALMAPLASQVADGTHAVAINTTSACTGPNCGSALYQLHVTVPNFTFPSGALTNDGTHAGSSAANGVLILDVCYPTLASCASSAGFDWAYTAVSGSDGTPPTAPQNLVCSQGSGQYTCTWSTSVDPANGVAHSNIASYVLRQGTTTVATVAATNPGLSNAYTRYTIGSGCGGSPSATQGVGAAGGRWTLTGCGYGLEGGKADQYSGIYAQVSGPIGCASGKVSSLTTPRDYTKAIFDARNSPLNDTSAHLAVYFMFQVPTGTWYVQYLQRSSDGGSQAASSAIPLVGSPPFYGELCDINNLFSFTYSSDGGAPTTAFFNVPLTLNSTKYFGFADSSTSDGTTGGAPVVVFDDAAVRNEYQRSTTVVSALSGNCTIQAKDSAASPNVSAALGNVPCGPQTSSGTGHKFHPGHYVRAHTAHLNCGASCDATRHGIYASTLTDANVKGVSIWASWKTLENDAGGDFTAGITWLRNEINFVKTNYPGKQVALLLDFSPYGWAAGAETQIFPNYFVNAGCTYDENSANTGGGSTSLNWFKTKSVCTDAFKRLIAAYGAVFDSEPALEYVRIQQETDDAINCCGISATGEDAGWKDIALAAVTAFPTTIIWIPVNWIGVDTAANKEALLVYYKSIGAGVGDGDTIPSTGTNIGRGCPSSAIECVIRGRNTAIGGSAHDYCGEFVSLSSMELSEAGYNTVPPGDLSAQEIVTSWNNDSCVQYGEWEPNFGEIFNDGMGGATQYWNGAMGQKWAIDNLAITHTTKPAGFN
jgi:hypothetical protein